MNENKNDNTLKHVTKKLDVRNKINENLEHKTQVMGQEKSGRFNMINIKTKGEIKEHDIVEGYRVGGILNDTSGESIIRFAEKDNQTFVIKAYRSNMILDSDIFTKLNTINSDNLLKPIKTGIHNGVTFEIQKYYKNKTLFDNLDKVDVKFLKRVVVPQLNHAINLLHNNNIIHNDIKPQNIFLSDNEKNVVLGDYGISKEIEGGKSYSTNIHRATTVLYAAPEGDDFQNIQTDYYSLGMTLYHLALGRDPFKNSSEHEIKMLKKLNQYKISDEIDKELRELIIMLTIYDPLKRATYEDVESWIKNKKYFSNQLEVKDYNIIETDIPFDITIEVDGVRATYNTLFSAVDVLNNNWETGIRYFASELVTNKIADSDADLYLKLKDIYSWSMRYDKEDLGLFMTLHLLNPNLDVIYKGVRFEDINSFINYLYKNENGSTELLLIPLFKPTLINNREVFNSLTNFFKIFGESSNSIFKLLSERIDLKKQNNESSYHRFSYIIDKINTDYTNKVLTEKDKDELLLDIFSNIFSRDNIYSNLERFDSIETFVRSLFNGDQVIRNKLEYYHGFLYELIKFRYNYSKTKLDNFRNEPIEFSRYLLLADLIGIEDVLVIDGVSIKNSTEFINEFNRKYENKEHLSNYLNFISDNKLRCLLELDQNKIASKILDLDTKDLDYVDQFYYITSNNPLFEGFETLEELISHLQSKKNILERINEIMSDKRFEYWLKSLNK